MHCLYLAQRIPFPPNKGEKLRSFHQINFLRSNGIEVTVAAPYEQSDELDYFKRLEQEYGCHTLSQALSHKLLRYMSGIAGNTSLSEAHFYSSGLQKQIDDLLERQNIDAIVCTASSMANYVFRSTALAKKARRPRLIMDFMDMDSHKWLQYSRNTKPPMRWVYQREASLVRRLENRVWSGCLIRGIKRWLPDLHRARSTGKVCPEFSSASMPSAPQAGLGHNGYS